LYDLEERDAPSCPETSSMLEMSSPLYVRVHKSRMIVLISPILRL
jgi:hypothetical protein